MFQSSDCLPFCEWTQSAECMEYKLYIKLCSIVFCQSHATLCFVRIVIFFLSRRFFFVFSYLSTVWICSTFSLNNFVYMLLITVICVHMCSVCIMHINCQTSQNKVISLPTYKMCVGHNMINNIDYHNVYRCIAHRKKCYWT